MRLFLCCAGFLMLLLAAPIQAGDYKLEPSKGLDSPPKLRQPKLQSPPKLGGYEGIPDKEEVVEKVEEPEKKGTPVFLLVGGGLILLLALKEAFS